MCSPRIQFSHATFKVPLQFFQIFFVIFCGFSSFWFLIFRAALFQHYNNEGTSQGATRESSSRMQHFQVLLQFQQVFEENLAINLDPEKLMYLFICLLFISLFMYASCRCGTGRSFDAKIVKLGSYILWPCKMGEFEDEICWTNRKFILWDSDFLKEPQLA